MKALAIIVVCGVLLGVLCGACTSTSGTSKTMYVCGYDRCKDSATYGKLVQELNIRTWAHPEPNKGNMMNVVSLGEAVTVDREQVVKDGPGGRWYYIRGVGWTNDLWLTDEVCTPENLDKLSFTDCAKGVY